jgi:hypothetical protein
MTTTSTRSTLTGTKAPPDAGSYSTPDVVGGEYKPPTVKSQPEGPANAGTTIRIEGGRSLTVSVTYDAAREKERAQLREINRKR